MGGCGKWVRANAGAVLLAGAAVSLFALLIAADARLGLHRHVSNRYRFHAIPVAVSRIAHGRPHDYTAFAPLAYRFHDGSRDLDEQLAESLAADPGTGTYFWVADDRGLADYTAAAFRTFGFRARSLSDFWFLILGVSVGLFVVGYWRRPGFLVLPVFVLFGMLILAESFLLRDRIPFDGLPWREPVGLSEPRLFDALALVAVLHLALVASGGAGRAVWVTGVLQAGLLIFLYHCRSSLGWQYLALFVLVAARAGWCLSRGQPRDLRSPFFVAGLLISSLAGLTMYTRATYHPEYLAERGSRTFWHNALMGLSYHPRLRADLPMPGCDDRAAVELVLGRLRQGTPAPAWDATVALNSLGSHNGFDWPAYEAAARAGYFGLWRTRPRHMLSCHAVYKPKAVVRQSVALTRAVGGAALAGRAWELVGGGVVVLGACVGLWWVGGRNASSSVDCRGALLVTAGLLPFSLLPAIAFYPAMTTTGGFVVLARVALGIGIVRLACSVSAKLSPHTEKPTHGR